MLENILNYNIRLETITSTLFASGWSIAATIIGGYFLGMLTIGRLMVHHEARLYQKRNKVNHVYKGNLDANGLTDVDRSNLSFTFWMWIMMFLYLVLCHIPGKIGNKLMSTAIPKLPKK